MNKTYLRHSGSQSNWKAALEEIKAGRQELRVYGDTMSEYERNVINRDLKARSEAIYPVAAGAVIGEYKAAIKSYQDSLAAIDAERTKEINRFDSAKFNTELQTIQARVELALKTDVNPLRAGDTLASKKLAAIYAEAIQSNDLHKQRAAVEVFKALPLPIGNPEERIVINQLAKDAEAAERKLRDTPALEKARQSRIAALDTLGAKQNQLIELSQELGSDDPRGMFASDAIAKAYKLVEWPKGHRDNEGAPVGEVIIHKEADPEVTGVYWKA